MSKVTLPACFVEKKNANGTARFYWQPSASLRAAGFQGVRLSDELALAIQQATARNADVQRWREGGDSSEAAVSPGDRQANERRSQPGDKIGDLIDLFENHAEFKAKPAATQAAYKSAYRLLRAIFGTTSWRALTPVQVRQAKRSIAKQRPGMAALFVGAGAALYAHGILNIDGFGFRPQQSPFHAQGGGYTPKRVPVIWTVAMRDQVMRAAAILGWDSFAAMTRVNYWLGQRPGDLTRLTRAALQGGVLRFVVQKTGAEAVLPVHVVAEAEAAIAAELARQDARNQKPIEAGPLFVNERTGRAWTDGQREKAFEEIRALAAAGSVAHGLEPPATGDRAPLLEPMPECATLWFRELRHTTVLALAEANCTDTDIASITRHSLASIKAMLDKHYWQATEKQAARALRARLQAG